jgi:hypothetical protein
MPPKLCRAISIALLLPGLLLSGCNTPFRATPVGDLLKAPGTYDGKPVKVVGQVTSVVKLPFVAARFFTLKDDTGEIMIVTYDETPVQNSTTTATGVFSTVAISGAIPIGSHITVGHPPEATAERR